MDIVSIIISTTLELPTLENGAIRIVYPTLLTPIVKGQMPTSRSENGGKSEETGYTTIFLSQLTKNTLEIFYLILYISQKCMLSTLMTACSTWFSQRIYITILLRPTSCFGATSGKQDRVLDSEQQCAHAIFTSPAANLAPYELNFQLLVRGACLLAGTSSPLKSFWFTGSWLSHLWNIESKIYWKYIFISKQECLNPNRARPPSPNGESTRRSNCLFFFNFLILS